MYLLAVSMTGQVSSNNQCIICSTAVKVVNSRDVGSSGTDQFVQFTAHLIEINSQVRMIYVRNNSDHCWARASSQIEKG